MICARCHKPLKLDGEWTAPYGINHDMRRYVCEKGHEYFVIKGRKK